MKFRTHTISKLKHDPALHCDRQIMNLGKHRLLAEIARRDELRVVRSISSRERFAMLAMRIVRKMVPSYQLAGAALIILMLMTSTGLIAQAAVPGDMLWPVKITIEKAEVALATTAASEGHVHIRHVDNRLRELSVVLAQSDTKKKSANMSQLVRKLEQDITAANQSLKITQAVEQGANPEVVAALAKNLSDKAVEVVKVLEENKQAIADIDADVAAEFAESGAATSTQVAVGESPVATSTSASSGEGVARQAPETVAQVVSEVRKVYETISYSALEAMIDLLEHGQSANRAEVTAIMLSKIDEQQARWEVSWAKVPLMTNNFILHRNESRSLLLEAGGLLEESSDLVKLDFLSGAFKAVFDAKNDISRAEEIIAEVEEAHGIMEPVREAPAATQTPEKPVDAAVTVQSFVASSTNVHTDDIHATDVQ